MKKASRRFRGKIGSAFNKSPTLSVVATSLISVLFAALLILPNSLPQVYAHIFLYSIDNVESVGDMVVIEGVSSGTEPSLLVSNPSTSIRIYPPGETSPTATFVASHPSHAGNEIINIIESFHPDTTNFPAGTILVSYSSSASHTINSLAVFIPDGAGSYQTPAAAVIPVDGVPADIAINLAPTAISPAFSLFVAYEGTNEIRAFAPSTGGYTPIPEATFTVSGPIAEIAINRNPSGSGPSGASAGAIYVVPIGSNVIDVYAAGMTEAGYASIGTVSAGDVVTDIVIDYPGAGSPPGTLYVSTVDNKVELLAPFGESLPPHIFTTSTLPNHIALHINGSFDAYPTGTIFVSAGMANSLVHLYSPSGAGSDVSGGSGGPDETPPVLSLPAPITAEATGPSGAVVTYTATASDAVDGPVAVSCLPASGSTFALGTTTVTCSATDSHLNTANGAFTVTVQDTTPPVFDAYPAQVFHDRSTGSPAYTTPTATDIVDPIPTIMCTPGPSASFAFGPTTVNCTAEDKFENSTPFSFILREVEIDTLSTVNTGLHASLTDHYWGIQLKVNGDVQGLVEGDVTPTARINFGDGTPVEEVPPASPFSQTHIYAKPGTYDIDVKLVIDGTEVGENDQSTVSSALVKKRPTQFAAVDPITLSADSVKWHHMDSITKTLIVDAIQDDHLGVAGLLIDFTGDAIDPDLFDIASTGDGIFNPPVPFRANMAVGPQTLIATATTGPLTDALYEAPTTPASKTVLLLQHASKVTISGKNADGSIPDTPWGLKIGAETLESVTHGIMGDLTDLDATPADPVLLPDMPISFSGSGAAGLAATTTNALGAYSAQGDSPGIPPQSGLAIIPHFDGSTFYYASNFPPNTDPTILYNTIKHITKTVANPVAIIPPTDTVFAFSGKLFDDILHTELADKQIFFTGNGATPSMGPVTTAPLTISHTDSDGLDMQLCTGLVGPLQCNTPQINLYAKSGTTFTFPQGTNEVWLKIDGMGTAKFDYTVTHYFGAPSSGSTQGISPLINNHAILNAFDPVTGAPLEIQTITITNVQEDTSPTAVPNPYPGRVAISSIITKNGQDVPVEQARFDLNFEDQTVGFKTSPKVFGAGSFFNNGFAVSSVDADSTTPFINDPFELVANFAEEENYFGSTGSTLYFTQVNINGVFGAGSYSGVDDVINYISYIDCGLLDGDGDAICDTWEDGVIEDAAMNVYNFDPAELPDQFTPDVYVELDWIRNHEPSDLAIADVEQAFADHGINLHIMKDEQVADTGTELLILNYWTDGDPTNPDGDGNFLNDFNSLKKDHFGTASERAGGSLRDGTNISLNLKAQVFRYGISAHCIGADPGPSGAAELGGNDFMIALGCGFGEDASGHSVGTQNEQAGTLMHEIGHLLGLRHGGEEDTNCMPSYVSVMSYARQLPSITDPTTGVTTILLGETDWALDFQGPGLPTPDSLNEANLGEALGMTNPPGDTTTYHIIWGTPSETVKVRTAVLGANIDWNGDGIIGTPTVSGTQANIVTDGSYLGYHFKMRGLQISTTGPMEGTLVYKVTGTWASARNPGTITMGTPVFLAANAANGDLATDAHIFTGVIPTPTVTGTGATRTFTIKVPFSTDAAVTNGDLASLKVPFSGTNTNRVLSSVATVSGFPTVRIEVDFNNLSAVGCAGGGTIANPHDDWSNLDYSFRTAGAAFDGATAQANDRAKDVSRYPPADEIPEDNSESRADLANSLNTYKGPLPPINAATLGDPSSPPVSKVKFGQTIPFKAKVKDTNGNSVTDATIFITYKKVCTGTCGEDTEQEALTNSPGSSCTTFNGQIRCYMKYDATTDQYVFNFPTKPQLGDTASKAAGTWGFKFIQQKTTTETRTVIVEFDDNGNPIFETITATTISYEVLDKNHTDPYSAVVFISK